MSTKHHYLFLFREIFDILFWILLDKTKEHEEKCKCSLCSRLKKTRTLQEELGQ